MKLARIITHPQTGSRVLALPGETNEQAIDRYNTHVLGFTPDAPAVNDFNPEWVSLYKLETLLQLEGWGVSEVHDPDTYELISVAQYIENYQRYEEERTQPFEDVN